MPVAPTSGQALPPIRRLRVCLLGGDTFQHGVGKADIAAALLRGLTSDRPGTSDPILDLAFEYGVFERAWRKLLDPGRPQEPPRRGEEEDGEPEPAQEPFVPMDVWGVGPLAAWDSESRIVFDRRGPGEGTPPYEAEPSDETASLCAGNPEKLNMGHKRAGGLLGAFREALGANGQDVGALEQVHRNMSEVAAGTPREMVRKDSPCPGLAAAFARFSPEVGGFAGCGTAVLHIFEKDCRPLGNSSNVAMLYACAPNGRVHTMLSPSTFLCSLRCIGSNIARLVREYNRSVGAMAAPESWERTTWFEADLRARVEYYLSDRNLATDSFLQEKILGEENGYVDLEVIKGCEDVTLQAQLLGALSASKMVETKVADDGRVCVRRMGGKAPPTLEDGSQRKRKYVQGPGGGGLQGDRNDPTCWDWVRRGYCPRGDSCRYAHAPSSESAAAAATATVDGGAAGDSAATAPAIAAAVPEAVATTAPVVAAAPSPEVAAAAAAVGADVGATVGAIAGAALQTDVVATGGAIVGTAVEAQEAPPAAAAADPPAEKPEVAVPSGADVAMATAGGATASLAAVEATPESQAPAAT